MSLARVLDAAASSYDPTFYVWVPGSAAPQGSKRHVGRGLMVESSRFLRPWRALVVDYCLQALAPNEPAEVRAEVLARKTFVGPVEVRLDFYFDRPRSHFGVGKNSGLLKPSAPAYPRTGGDLDKLCRGVCDALGRKHGAGVIADDADIVWLTASKHYATNLFPVGCSITVEAARRV